MPCGIWNTVGWGDKGGGRFKAKSSSVNSQRSKVWKSKHALSHAISLSVNS